MDRLRWLRRTCIDAASRSASPDTADYHAVQLSTASDVNIGGAGRNAYTVTQPCSAAHDRGHRHGGRW